MDNIHPEDRHLVAEAMTSAVGDKPLERVTYRTVWPDASIHWVETIGRVFHDEAGKPDRVLGVSLDITERKSTEMALREAVERFQLLAVHAPVGIAQSDMDGNCFFVNPKWCEIAGAQPQDVMGHGWRNFLHPLDRDQTIQAWHAEMAAGQIHHSARFRFIRPDGTVRWASAVTSLVRDADGQAIGQIGIIEDVTQRKAVEDALREKESQLRGVMDHAAAVIYLKDLQGRYVLVNRRYRQLFCHLGDDDVIGKTDLQWFPADVAKAFMDADQAVIRQQAPQVFEEVAFHEDGRHTYRSVKFPVKDDAGNMIAVGGISTDISDLAAAHESLKKQEALLRSLIDVQEREKRFLCHEFHDGLIQYAVGAQLLLESLEHPARPADESVKLKAAVGELRRGIEDGRRVIRGIRPAVLDDSSIEDAIQDLIEQFSKSGILVTFRCDPAVGRLPESVQTTIYRVVQEAMNNARKHSGTDVVRIELRKPDGELQLDIQDFGCGFDVESARSRGFGLLGMTERVRLLGGDCLIRSEKDVGTRILARLPQASLATAT
jgi:PAS domain S-box-containing protein